MKVKLTTPEGDIVWVDISKAIVIKKTGLGKGSVIIFDMKGNNYILVQETMEEISMMLPGGLHDN